MDAFKTKFKAKFGTEVQVYAPYVYDSVKLMVAAMVKANSSDPVKYLPVLAATARTYARRNRSPSALTKRATSRTAL
jgi:ABC-type branched-subunit amino acid transport system substrate-binding protein